MRELVEFSYSSEFRQFFQRLLREKEFANIVHGVFIEQHQLISDFEEYQNEIAISGSIYAPFFRPDTIRHSLWEAHNYIEELNSWSSFHPWVKYCSCVGLNSKYPFTVKVMLNPLRSSEKHRKRPLFNIGRNQPFLIQFIEAPMPIMASHARCGNRILSSCNGSIGGVLLDQSGQKWGVTCGHVGQNVGDPVDIEDINGNIKTTASTVRYSNWNNLTINAQSVNGMLCNPQQKSLPENDLALLEVKNLSIKNELSTPTLVVDKIFDRYDLSDTDDVVMAGASSGFNSYRIAGYGVATKVALPGSSTGCICLTNTFKIKAKVKNWFINSRIGGAFKHRALVGDSGAWICHEYAGGQFAWYGNLVAVDGEEGIATFAESALHFAKVNWNIDLHI